MAGELQPWGGVEARGSVSMDPIPPLQVLCSSCHGPDRQLRDPQVGPGEDCQWHPAGDPFVCPWRVPGEDWHEGGGGKLMGGG